MENLTETVTLETLPKAFSILTTEVSEIKKMLFTNPCFELVQHDRWFNLEEFIEYHPDKPKKSTVYGWVSRNIVPHHKDGKKLRFLKSEIDNWLRQGKRLTNAEAAIQAQKYLINKFK
jgi:excisionase family DNA binding protein